MGTDKTAPKPIRLRRPTRTMLLVAYSTPKDDIAPFTAEHLRRLEGRRHASR